MTTSHPLISPAATTRSIITSPAQSRLLQPDATTAASFSEALHGSLAPQDVATDARQVETQPRGDTGDGGRASQYRERAAEESSVETVAGSSPEATRAPGASTGRDGERDASTAEKQSPGDAGPVPPRTHHGRHDESAARAVQADAQPQGHPPRQAAGADDAAVRRSSHAAEPDETRGHGEARSSAALGRSDARGVQPEVEQRGAGAGVDGAAQPHDSAGKPIADGRDQHENRDVETDGRASSSSAAPGDRASRGRAGEAAAVSPVPVGGERSARRASAPVADSTAAPPAREASPPSALRMPWSVTTDSAPAPEAPSAAPAEQAPGDESAADDDAAARDRREPRAGEPSRESSRSTPASRRAAQVEQAVQGRPPIEVSASPVGSTGHTPLGSERATASSTAVAASALLGPEEQPAAQSIVRGLTAMVGQRGGTMTMRLDPPELGALRIQMTIQQGAVAVDFHTASEQAGALIERGLAVLRTALEQQGLSVERMTVQHHTAPGTQSMRDDAQTPHDDRRDAQPDAGEGRSRGRRDEDAPDGQDGGETPPRDRSDRRRTTFASVAGAAFASVSDASTDSSPQPPRQT